MQGDRPRHETRGWRSRIEGLCAIGLVSVAVAGSHPACAGEPPREAAKVSIVGSAETGFRLERGGAPYFVKGVGLGNGSIEQAHALGANSFRTWGSDQLDKELAEAQARGMTVCAGFWLGHERHGFRYGDAAAVARQAEAFRNVVLKYKDHPALLAWGIGNEMEGEGTNPAIWEAVENLARMARELDPNHPTMTVIAELGKDGLKVKEIHRLCPSIDIIGINTYGTGATVPTRYRAAGGQRPYILTEFGPRGWWEAPKSDWGAAIEPTSTEKARTYREVYAAGVKDQPLCLGSYGFLWGWKQEATATWFGLVLPDGSRVEAADVLSAFWTGRPVANQSPKVEPLAAEGGHVSGQPGDRLTVKLTASDPEGDPLTVAWSLQREGTPAGGGDAEPEPPSFPQNILESDPRHAVVQLPSAPGGYRLFATVRDNHGGAATANLPVRSGGEPVAAATVKPGKLPLLLDEAASQPNFLPTGWMGNQKAVAMDANWAENPHGGGTCLRIDYRDSNDWAGVVWQYPANDWGEKPGALDLTGARKLRFWARGARGGEVVGFKFGILGPEKPFPDSARGETGEIRLTPNWTRYEIDLGGKDLSRIKTGFCWVLAAQGQPVTFFLDEIAFTP